MKTIQSVWPGISKIDAAYEYKKTNTAIFFEGMKTWFLCDFQNVRVIKNKTIFSCPRKSLLGNQRKDSPAWLPQTSEQLWLPSIRDKDRCCCACAIHKQDSLLCEKQVLEVRNINYYQVYAKCIDIYHMLTSLPSLA